MLAIKQVCKDKDDEQLTKDSRIEPAHYVFRILLQIDRIVYKFAGIN